MIFFFQLLVLKYVQNKDVFMRYHKAHLTRRLILDISADSEIEENMVEWLRVGTACVCVCMCVFAWESSSKITVFNNINRVIDLTRRWECQLTMSTNWPGCFRTSRFQRTSTSRLKKCTSITSLPCQVRLTSTSQTYIHFTQDVISMCNWGWWKVFYIRFCSGLLSSVYHPFYNVSVSLQPTLSTLKS